MVFAATTAAVAGGGGMLYNIIPSSYQCASAAARQGDPMLFLFTDQSRSQPPKHLSWRCSAVVAGGHISIRRHPHSNSRRNNRRRPFFPVMEWQESTVKMDIDVPISVAYNCYLDRESIPRWMPFISTVEILKDEPELSRWSLKYTAFGRDIKFSWLARNMQPIPNQKIHWRSMEGLPNRGAVRFFPKGPSSCTVELTVAYEVPQLLSPVASALKPFMKSLLGGGLERFSKFAKSYSTGVEVKE